MIPHSLRKVVPEEMQQKTIDLFRRILKSVSPPPKLNVSDWADRYRVLSSETSAEPGRWRTDRTPYMREIMNAATDPNLEKVVVESSSQVGKSEFINNVIGYYIDTDPGPMLLVEPTLEMARDYSKQRIAPMIRDTEPLTAKVADSKTRDIDNTILMKVFPGGFLAIGGANSPAGLASRPIRILLADEIDRYPDSAGTEGDPLALAEKRTQTFVGSLKKIFVSTPTIKDASRIEIEYESGTQEKWKLACPACGCPQYINLRQIKFQYSKDEKQNYRVWDVMFQCPDCGEAFDELTWKDQPGRWIADNPGAVNCRSFHVNAFVSPWVSWESIILEWLKVKRDPERYKVFVNTVEGRSWEERGEADDYEALYSRREDYPAQLPNGVLLLTAGVDVQGDRLEYEIVGWGHGEESWGIEYGAIWSDPEVDQTWKDLLGVLTRTYRYADGSGLRVACSCVDSGGHSTEKVYKFAKANEFSRIFAIKGMGGPGLALLHKATKTEKEKARLFILGVDAGKSTIMSRLKIKETGPGYCHWPTDNRRGYSMAYFEGLLAEHQVPRKRQGRIYMVWEKVNDGARNEPLDARNYAQAALQLINPDFDKLELARNGYRDNVELPEKQTKTPQKRARGV